MRSGIGHKIYISVLSLLVFLVLLIMAYWGYGYYNTGLEERFYHADHDLLKPSGAIGHGLGIFGSLLILIGVTSYMARKRYRWMMRWGKLEYWLEFHIFLCTLGPVMILYHTAFKFGGIVSVSFWSMVAVFLSGVIGRFIYLQIPRSIEGRELSLGEVKDLKTDIAAVLQKEYNLNGIVVEEIVESTQKKAGVFHSNPVSGYFSGLKEDSRTISRIRSKLSGINLKQADSARVLRLVKNEMALNHKIDRLQTMQNLFKYWHVAHLPFALVMLVIMIVHVIVTIVFGYRWIF
jgi:uncharacterized membrane protein